MTDTAALVTLQALREAGQAEHLREHTLLGLCVLSVELRISPIAASAGAEAPRLRALFESAMRDLGIAIAHHIASAPAATPNSATVTIEVEVFEVHGEGGFKTLTMSRERASKLRGYRGDGVSTAWQGFDFDTAQDDDFAVAAERALVKLLAAFAQDHRAANEIAA